ncbi:RNase H domain-containing protein [Trichonephila clavipes]|nr:RNase H domain-containing protein [Trichonephila clavipes]
MSDPMQQPVCYQDLKTSIQHCVHHIWQEKWDQQILNKQYSIQPSTSHWAALPVRRHDVRLTRLRIGHTRFTHRHLLLGAAIPEDATAMAIFCSERILANKIIIKDVLPVPPGESKEYTKVTHPKR